MREILFRGKNPVSDEWAYGSLILEKNAFDERLILAIISDADGNETLVNPETISQYTGLTDKNGKTIFVGDILRVEQRGETGSRTCPVYFGEYIDADSVFDDYRCIGFYIKTSDGCGNIGFLLDSEFECEVIGNIHDNPELMEKE